MRRWPAAGSGGAAPRAGPFPSVALHRSVGDAALQTGNSEAIVKLHYLTTHTQDEGSAFFRVTPDLKRRRAVLAAVPKTNPKAHLKVRVAP